MKKPSFEDRLRERFEEYQVPIHIEEEWNSVKGRLPKKERKNRVTILWFLIPVLFCIGVKFLYWNFLASNDLAHNQVIKTHHIEVLSRSQPKTNIEDNYSKNLIDGTLTEMHEIKQINSAKPANLVSQIQDNTSNQNNSTDSNYRKYGVAMNNSLYSDNYSKLSIDKKSEADEQKNNSNGASNLPTEAKYNINNVNMNGELEKMAIILSNKLPIYSQLNQVSIASKLNYNIKPRFVRKKRYLSSIRSELSYGLFKVNRSDVISEKEQIFIAYQNSVKPLDKLSYAIILDQKNNGRNNIYFGLQYSVSSYKLVQKFSDTARITIKDTISIVEYIGGRNEYEIGEKKATKINHINRTNYILRKRLSIPFGIRSQILIHSKWDLSGRAGLLVNVIDQYHGSTFYNKNTDVELKSANKFFQYSALSLSYDIGLSITYQWTDRNRIGLGFLYQGDLTSRLNKSLYWKEKEYITFTQIFYQTRF